MKLNLIALAAGLVMGASAFAQTTSNASTSSTNLSNLYNQLKESPASLSYATEFSAGRKDEPGKPVTLSQWTSENILTAGYKIDDKNSVNVASDWITTRLAERNEDGNLYNTDWALINVNYFRSGLLTQDKHGVSATLYVRQRLYPDAQYRSTNNLYGYTRAGVIWSRSFGKLSVSAPTLFAVYNRRDKELQDTARSYFYVPASVSYSVSDKLAVYFNPEYFHNYRGAEATRPDAETLDVSAGVSYDVNKQINVGASAGVAGLMSGTDGRTFKKNIQEEVSYAVDATFSIF